MTNPAGSTETVSQEPMSQEDADKAFELDLANAGLLDSALEHDGDTVASDEPETPAVAAVPPGATPEVKAGETPPAAPKADATIAETPKAETPPAEPTAQELLAKAVPFAFTSDGKSSTVEIIREIPGEGIVIEAPHVEQFRNMIQTADKALRDNVTLRETMQRYDKLGGTEKYRELESRSAALDAMGTELLKILTDPEKLISLATDPRERNMLLRELQFMGNTKAQEAAQQFGVSLTEADQGRQQEAQDAQAFDLAVQSIAKALPMLTAEDHQAIRAQFSQPGMKQALYRKAGPDDVKYGFQVGQRLLDIPVMHPFAESLARIRVGQKAEADARLKAEAENKQRQSAPPPPARRPQGQRPGAGRTAPKAKDKSWSQIKSDWLAGRHSIAAEAE